jgi:23S rRNA (adenine2503-C2)-methyltransferase
MALPNNEHRPTSAPGDEPRHLFDLGYDDLVAWLDQRGERPYRARQILEWIYRHQIADFDAVSSLSKRLRVQLAASFSIYQSSIERTQAAADGTTKLLLRWPDGATTECVLIPDGKRQTACISTQVGCPVRCVFCASGIDGLTRNLTRGQIVEQAMRVAQLICKPDRLTNVVFMGLGEPLANYAATVGAISVINAADGLNIGARKITVSTVGLPSQMRRLAEAGWQITLALSLHAPTDALRRELIPWADNVTINELVDAARYFFECTGREVTLEYVLLDGVNNRPEHADRLAALTRRMRCNVNLIRYHPVEGLPYTRPTGESTHAFVDRLANAGVNVHVRKSRGLDIDAACGQLRRRAAAVH